MGPRGCRAGLVAVGPLEGLVSTRTLSALTGFRVRGRRGEIAREPCTPRQSRGGAVTLISITGSLEPEMSLGSRRRRVLASAGGR